MYLVAMSGQCICRFINGSGFIEFNTERAFCQFSVVVDADIFNAYIVRGEQRSNGGNRAGFICDVHCKNMLCFDWAAGYIDKRFTVTSCGIEEIKECVCCSVVDVGRNFREVLDITL